jgi:RHS repeat-associated protein
LIAVLATAGLLATDVQTIDPASATPFVGGEIAKPRVEPLTAPDVVSARVQALATGSRVQVLSETTETSQTWVNPDGTFTTESTGGPARIADESAPNGWRELDFTLVERSDGTVGPVSGYTDISLSGKATAAQVAKNGVARLEGQTGSDIILGWAGALPKPTLDAQTATYKNVLPSIDLVITVTPTGVEQFYVVKSKPKKGFAVDIPLSMDGLQTSTDADGSIALKDKKNKNGVAGTIPAAYMWDARVDPASGLPANVTQVGMTADADSLTLVPTAGFFDDPKIQYPVTIDPTINNVGPSYDTFVRSDGATTNYNTYTPAELQVGTYTSGGMKARSYLNFPTAGWAGAKVTSATLSLFLFHSWSCTDATMYVYAANPASASTTWNAQPGYNTSYMNSASFADGYTGCGATWEDISVTGVADYLASLNLATVGMALLASETSNSGWKRFYSQNNPGGYYPVLSVTYNSYPNTATAPTLAPVTSSGASLFTTSTTPTFTAKSTDAEGSNTSVTFEVHSSTTVGTGTLKATCTTAFVASGTDATCASSTALVDGTTYYVRARGNDSALSSLAWSAFTAFTVSTAPPPAATISCPNPYTNVSWTTAVPTSAVACTVVVAKYTPVNRAQSVAVQIDGGTATTTWINVSGGTVNVSVPATSGPHSITATTQSAAGLTTAATYAFGYGTAGISAPTETSTTNDTVRLSAAAPPRGSSTVTAVLKWRPANAASTTWNTAAGAVTVNSGTGTTPVTVDNFVWSTKLATTDTSTGTSVTLNPRLPVLLELQICFTYTPGGTKCTSDGAVPTQVLRVPHAFGDGFPVAAAGDGQLALWTGELNLDATDVSVTTLGGTLSVSRNHSTFAGPQDAVTSAFGTGWSASFDGAAGATSLQVVDSTTIDGTISLMRGDGTALVFRHEANGVTSAPAGNYLPVDDATATTNAQLTVTGTGSSRQLLLTTVDGTKTLWAPLSGSATPITWVPVSVTQPGAVGTTSYTTNSIGQVTRILAPVPAGVTCGATLVAGCSALNINYASSTTATSGTPGNFNHQVTTISYETFDPGANAMTTTSMASYKYDTSGRIVSVKNELLDTTTSYSYSTYSGNTALTQIDRTGYASTYFAYDTTGSVKLKNVSRGGSVSGEATSIQSAYVYAVPVTTSGLPSVSATTVAKWGQTRVATAAYAVFGADHPVTSASASGISSGDWVYSELYFTDADGYAVNSAQYGAGQWLLSAYSYDAEGKYVNSLGPVDTNAAVAAAAAGQPFVAPDRQVFTRFAAEVPSSDPARPLIAADSLVVDDWSAPTYAVLASGSTAWVRTHTHYTYDEGAPHSNVNPATSKPYLLPTTVTVGVTTAANYSTDPSASLAADLETIAVTQYGYAPIDGAGVDDPTSGWVLGSATTTTTAMSNSADNITRKVRFNAAGATVESREPLSVGNDAGSTLTVTYTAGANAADAACGNKPAWAGLACWNGPAAAPETGVDIADKRVTAYSKWLAPTEIVETSGTGASTRTTTVSYLADGRPDQASVATTGLTGSQAVPAQKVIYDATTKAQSGVATLNSTGVPLADVTWTTDLWGRQKAYVNVQDETTTTAYVAPGAAGAGQVASVTNPRGSSTYSYDGTDAAGKTDHRGLATGLSISDVGSFSAAYDASGALVTQVMPAGLRQDLSYTDQGALSSLVYSGAVGAGTGAWLSYSRDYDTAGRVAHEWTPVGGSSVVPNGYASAYGYDRAGRLTTVQSATSGVGGDACATRQYAFDKQGNRTSLTSTVAAACATTGGTTTTWAYDAYSRQTTAANGSGSYVYDGFGRQTLLPAADAPNPAGGDITIGYYDTDAVASMTQGATTESFTLDPIGRRLQHAISDGTTTVTVDNHYGEGSDNPSWATQVSGGTVTTSRYMGALAGGLSVTSTTDGSTTVNSLTIAAPGGSVVATVAIPASGSATGISGYATTDEYGVAANHVDTGVVQYGWHGSAQRAITGIGLTLMGARVYNSSTARFTSVDPQAGGNENAYNYPNDPINLSDITGRMAAVIAIGGILALVQLLLEVLLIIAIVVILVIALFMTVQAIVKWIADGQANRKPYYGSKTFPTRTAAYAAAAQYISRLKNKLTPGQGWQIIFRGPHPSDPKHVHVEVYHYGRLMWEYHFRWR